MSEGTTQVGTLVLLLNGHSSASVYSLRCLCPKHTITMPQLQLIFLPKIPGC